MLRAGALGFGALAMDALLDFGYRAVRDRVRIPDLHATLLHQLGLDHERVTFRHHGRNETLTDAEVSGARVVSEVIG